MGGGGLPGRVNCSVGCITIFPRNLLERNKNRRGSYWGENWGHLKGEGELRDSLLKISNP